MNNISFIFAISILLLTSCDSPPKKKKEENIDPLEIKNEYPKSEKQPQKSTYKLTDESIVALLTKKKSEIIQLLGQHEEGNFAIAECHQMIPALIFDNGLTVYFTNLEDDEQPISIELNDKITFKGIKAGLIFGEVQNILGGEDISETWIATEDDKAYELVYYYGHFSVSVISYNENGDASSIILAVSHLNIFSGASNISDTIR